VVVARHGVIVTHEAFGRDANGRATPLDYRCWVASLTKTVTSLMFSQFLDQGLIELDAPVSSVFPDYPVEDPHVPTFRQCLNHTSGLTGHGDFGGMKNPQLENVLLNGIDAIEPNSRYAYSGMGYELAAKAMEIVCGKASARIFEDHLFQPLGFGDAVMGNASSDGEFTAFELAVLGQLVANQGRYGSMEFISAETFQSLLPQPIRVHDGMLTEGQGLGLHRISHRRMGATTDSTRTDDLLFGPRTIGHGSFSGCVLLVDPDQNLVITMVRRQTGPRHADWSNKFFQTIADVIVP
jgi:CubicO group peptidase (beta-lactamase class C family)